MIKNIVYKIQACFKQSASLLFNEIIFDHYELQSAHEFFSCPNRAFHERLECLRVYEGRYYPNWGILFIALLVPLPL